MEVKHYLGDIKWVLYSYINDLNSQEIVFRCGKYAYNKIGTMQGFRYFENPNTKRETGKLNLNGEIIEVINIPELDKKILIISPNDHNNFREEDPEDRKQYNTLRKEIQKIEQIPEGYKTKIEVAIYKEKEEQTTNLYIHKLYISTITKIYPDDIVLYFA